MSVNGYIRKNGISGICFAIGSPTIYLIIILCGLTWSSLIGVAFAVYALCKSTAAEKK